MTKETIASVKAAHRAEVADLVNGHRHEISTLRGQQEDAAAEGRALKTALSDEHTARIAAERLSKHAQEQHAAMMGRERGANERAEFLRGALLSRLTDEQAAALPMELREALSGGRPYR